MEVVWSNPLIRAKIMCRNSLIYCQIFKNDNNLIVEVLELLIGRRWRDDEALELVLVDPAGGVVEVWSDRSSGRFHGPTQDYLLNRRWFLWRSGFALGSSWQAQRRSWGRGGDRQRLKLLAAVCSLSVCFCCRCVSLLFQTVVQTLMCRFSSSSCCYDDVLNSFLCGRRRRLPAWFPVCSSGFSIFSPLIVCFLFTCDLLALCLFFFCTLL